MKYRLLDLLACPACGAYPFHLKVLEAEPHTRGAMMPPQCSHFCGAVHKDLPGESRTGTPDCRKCYSEEIRFGLLSCPSCPREYPIIDGVPRFNPDTFEEYPQHAEKFRPHFRQSQNVETASFRAAHAHTKKSFGYQWLKFKAGVGTDEDNAAHFYRRTQTKPGQLGKTLFFEAGCGMGRYLKVIGGEPEAEVVGLDLSLAVNRAYEENRQNPRVHVVQGNILEMPFRPEIFDHTYSIGVLHHTPDTKRAFLSMVRLLKPGGRATVWLYHKWVTPEMHGFPALHARVKGWITDGLRMITTRMPHSLLSYLCVLAIPVGWLQMKIIDGPKPIRYLLSPLLLVNCSVVKNSAQRVCDTFDWYAPMYQWKHTVPEVVGWFRELGYESINPEGFPVSVRGTRPVRQNERTLTGAGSVKSPDHG